MYRTKNGLLELLETMSVKEISQKYQVTHGTITYYKRKFNLYDKRKSPVKFIINGTTAKGIDCYGREFFLDAEDVEKVSMRKWYVHQGYVKAMVKKTTILLHRLIMDCEDGNVVDHIDHNTMNNHKSNLRIATRAQNIQHRGLISTNTSGCTGVIWAKQKNKWRADIEVNKKRIHIGLFLNKEEAIEARKEAERKYFGEFTYKVDH